MARSSEERILNTLHVERGDTNAIKTVADEHMSIIMEPKWSPLCGDPQHGDPTCGGPHTEDSNLMFCILIDQSEPCIGYQNLISQSHSSFLLLLLLFCIFLVIQSVCLTFKMCVCVYSFYILK